MDAGLYKSQFVQFLNLLYPCGLPERSIPALKWQVDGIEFTEKDHCLVTMAIRVQKACNHPRCPNTTDSKYCLTHTVAKKQVERYRGTANGRGYDTDWSKIRLTALQRDNYLCVHCKAQDILTEAKEVDHIIPITEAPHLRLVLSNLQSLCIPCHRSKTYQEQHQAD